jgi:hypothetical protein
MQSKFCFIFFVSLLFPCILFSQLDTRLEAEDQILTPTYVEKLGTGNASGGNWILLKNNPKGSLELVVNNIPSMGAYKLNIYHFNDNNVQEAAFSLNGQASQTISLNASNWEYQGLAQLTSIDVSLQAGVNTFTFKRITHNLHFDYFTVTTETPTAPVYTYYVSSSGDDSNAGTSESSPWKTIEKLNTALASDNNGGFIAPGDSVLFKRGDTFYGNVRATRSGTVDNPITISSYGDPAEELPIISGSGGTITGGDYFEAITMTNCSNYIISDIWVKNNRSDGSRYTYGEYNSYGIKVIANKWGGISNNLIFRGLKITDVFGITIPPPNEFNSLNATGIRFEADENEIDVEIAIKNVLIENSFFSNISKAGVWAIHRGLTDVSNDEINRNQDFIIKNNTFYRTGGSGVILSKVHKAKVENNDFDQTGHSNDTENRLAGRGSGMWVWSCRNIVAQYNRSYGIRGPNDSYGMHMDFNNKNIIFQYNYSEDSEGGFCEILGNNDNCTYRFNVSVNDGFRDFHGYTIWISGYVGTGNTPIRSTNNYIYNNTVYLGNSICTPRISIFAHDTYVYNNIFSALNGATIGYDSESNPSSRPGVSIDVGGGNFVMENNLFNGEIHPDFKNYGTNSFNGSPFFANAGGDLKEDYKVNLGSNAIDNGKSFPQPSFPLAGTGIFEDFSEHPASDVFGTAVDINNKTPNIGASNAHNSYTLGTRDYLPSQVVFRLSSNPVRGSLGLTFNKHYNSASIDIYDIVGKLVFKSKMKVIHAESNIQIPKNIKNGIYLLKVTADDISTGQKFILYR